MRKNCDLFLKPLILNVNVFFENRIYSIYKKKIKFIPQSGKLDLYRVWLKRCSKILILSIKVS